MTLKLITLIAVIAVVISAFFTYTTLKPQSNESTTMMNIPSTSPSYVSNTTYTVSSYVGVYGNSIFIVTEQQFSAVRILNHTFIRGGPIMVNPNNVEFIAEINSPTLAQEIKGMSQVQLIIYVNGEPETLTLPVKVLSSPLEPTAEFYPPTGPIPM